MDYIDIDREFIIDIIGLYGGASASIYVTLDNIFLDNKVADRMRKLIIEQGKEFNFIEYIKVEYKNKCFTIDTLDKILCDTEFICNTFNVSIN